MLSPHADKTTPPPSALTAWVLMAVAWALLVALLLKWTPSLKVRYSRTLSQARVARRKDGERSNKIHHFTLRHRSSLFRCFSFSVGLYWHALLFALAYDTNSSISRWYLLTRLLLSFLCSLACQAAGCTAAECTVKGSAAGLTVSFGLVAALAAFVARF